MQPLQVCTGAATSDYFTSFEFIKALTCTYIDATGLLVAGMLLYGAISTSIYIRTGSVVIPFVLLLMTGGAIMTQVAAPATTIATLLMLVTGAGVMTYLYYRYS